MSGWTLPFTSLKSILCFIYVLAIDWRIICYSSFYCSKFILELFLDFYEVEYDDGFQKIIHQSKIREQDTTNKVKTVKEYLNADKLQTVHLQISVCRYS